MTDPSQPPTANEDGPLPALISEPGHERGVVARAALLVAALALFALGVVGWLIPVMTGIPFWIMGFLVLGMASRRAARWINRQEGRLPRRMRLLLRPGHRRRKKAGDQ